jgi:hypothetical protein
VSEWLVRNVTQWTAGGRERTTIPTKTISTTARRYQRQCDGGLTVVGTAVGFDGGVGVGALLTACLSRCGLHCQGWPGGTEAVESVGIEAFPMAKFNRASALR